METFVFLENVVGEDDYYDRNCRGVDTNIFIPEPTRVIAELADNVERARQYCGTCVIRDECLATATINSPTSKTLDTTREYLGPIFIAGGKYMGLSESTQVKINRKLFNRELKRNREARSI